MREFIYDSWNSVMDAKHNPLRHIKDLQVRHIVLQLLAWMWCIIFAVMVGSWTVWGISVITHLVFIAGIVITVATFEAAKRSPQSFNFINGYHSPSRSRGSIWVDGKRVDLPKNDPGGEHE